MAKIRALLKKHDVDVLHPHGYKADLYAFAAATGNRAALLATSHNWPSRLWSMRAYAVLDRLVLRRFGKVIVVSDTVADILRRSGVPADRVAMIPNGVDLDRFRGGVPRLRNEMGLGHSPVVGFVGRLVKEKGGSLLIRAAQQVLRVHPKASFVLVGNGPACQEWQAEASKLGIAKHVFFAGARNDMPEVYASFDMVVLPSEIEALPMCLLEAMAAGKPVIATRVGAVPKLVLDAKTGFLLESGDVTPLTTAILRLLENPSMAYRLGENGRAHVAQHFSAQGMAKSYIGMYEQLLVRRADRRRKETAWECN